MTPNPPENKIKEVFSNIETKNISSAEELAFSLSKDYPGCIGTARLLADILLMQDKYTAAVPAYEKLTELNPTSAEAHYNLGFCLQESEKLDEALKEYQKSISCSPSFIDPFFNSSSIQKYNGDYAASVATLEKALEIEPNNKIVLDSLGDGLEKVGRYRDALQIFEKAPNPGNEHKKIGCLFSLKRHEEAIEHLVRCEKRDRDSGSLRISLAMVSALISKELGIENPYPFSHDPIRLIRKENVLKEIPKSGESKGPFIDELRKEIRDVDYSLLTNQSVKFGKRSEGTIFNAPVGAVGILKTVIEKKLSDYKNFLLQERENESPILTKWPKEFSLEAWAVEMSTDAFHEFHTHNTAWVSGVFYIDVIEELTTQNEGAIEFCLSNGRYPSKLSNEIVRIQPSQGDLLFFPSSLPHGTVPITSDGSRLCIAFDVRPKNTDARQTTH